MSSLEQLISQFTNPDNAVRGQAEQAFLAAATSQPEALLPELLNVARSAASPEVKSMATILFRRYAFEDERRLWAQCSPHVHLQLKALLLQALHDEPERSVRQKMSHVVAALHKFVDGAWPELLPFMFQCCNSPSDDVRESALEIFGYIPHIFGENLPRYVVVVKELFQRTLADPNPRLKLAALNTTISFLLVLRDADQAQMKLFADLLPAMFQIIALALNSGDEDAARDAISAFIDLAEASANFLKRSLDTLVPAMCQVVSTGSLEDNTRHVALELLVTLAEQAPAMIRKFPSFVPLSYPAAWSLMVDLDDDQDWHTTDEIEEDEMDSNAVVGEQGVDRIACALGGKTVMPYAFSVLPGMLQHADWKHRYAALMTISAIGEGCHKVMIEELDKILAVIRNMLHDPHPRVRYALCNALGQMSTDFQPTMQSKFHQVVLPVLLAAMEDRGNPRVQSHGAAALVNFAEEASKTTLMPYLDSILTRLLVLIKMPEKRYVMEQAVTSLATVADSAEDRFLQYYDTFMPVLVDLMAKATGTENRLLRGKIVECISLIGLAVGKDKFLKDAKVVMDLLMQGGVELEPDDPQISYMLSSWARIGAILGEDFIPFLPIVMPPLLRSATVKPDVAVIGPNDDTDAFDPNDGWEFVTLDNQQVGIRTSNLEEKCTAVEMLYCYAKELKAGFHQYVAQVMEIVVPLLKFYFDDSVRIAAAAALAPLLDSVRLAKYDPQYVQNLWLGAFDPLVEVTKKEPESDIVYKFAEALGACLHTMGPNSLDQPRLAGLADALTTQIMEALKRGQERLGRRNDEDYDEEVEEELAGQQDNDYFTLREIGDTLHAAFKNHVDAFLPFVEQMLPLVTQLLQPTGSVAERQWALCVLDDIIEFSGPKSWNYQAIFLPALQAGLTDKAPEIRQAAAYGVGMCAKAGGPSYAAFCAQCVPLLLQMATAKNARSDDNVNATENAISAIARIVEFNGGGVADPNLLSTWLSLLPVLVDAEEGAYCYDFLVRLVESNHQVILGPNNSNLPKIVAVLAEALATEMFEEDAPVVPRMLGLLKTIQSQVPAEMRDALWASVPEEYKQLLAEMFH